MMTRKEDIEELFDRLRLPAGFFYEVSVIRDAWDEKTLAADVDEHLTGAELACLAALRSKKRRAEFCAGRVAAKRLLSRAPFNLNPRWVEVVRLPSGAPQLLYRDSPYGHDSSPTVCVSITHCAEFAIAVVAPVPVGVDLEREEHRSDAFVRNFFSQQERALTTALRHDLRDRAVNMLWSRKEAACKVYHSGSRLVCRELDCTRTRVKLAQHTIDCRSSRGDGFVASVAYAGA